MTTREWLGRARTIEREINALIRAKEEARASVLRVTQSYQADVVQSTKDPHKNDRLVVLESLIDGKVDELVAVKTEITEAISHIPDGKQRTVLYDFYVRCISLEQTAVEIHYSYANVKKLRAKAIRSLEEVYPQLSIGTC